jgi:cell shape-determining protein MreC
MNLIAVFTVLNQLKIDHWQTKSYAEHKALNKAYENLDGLFDKFVEVYYGRTSIPDKTTNYSIKIESYKGDLISSYTALKNEIVTYLSSICEEFDDLQNIKDEIEGEFNHLLYRLQQK